jgi:hypothetical protein
MSIQGNLLKTKFAQAFVAHNPGKDKYNQIVFKKEPTP